jgi:hypothetical protein
MFLNEQVGVPADLAPGRGQINIAKKILIVGAGAIGRGYLPWLFSPDEYDLIFIDADPRVVSLMRQTGHYVTYRVRDGGLEQRRVRVHAAYTPSEFRSVDHTDAVACFFNVGPRNVAQAAEHFKGTTIPLILCENEPVTVDMVKGVVGHDRVYFAVPDVITSNTAPDYLLEMDPLSVVTEDGSLFIQEGPDEIRGSITFLPAKQLFDIQWIAKLYLHNTPHCIAAYLGAYVGATYIHEAMLVPQIDTVVQGAFAEMLKALKMQSDVPHDFLQWYADKELARFRCKQLFDPVSRVAREPMRKLEIHGRLLGAAQKCLSLGIVPENILIGITAASMFENSDDPDHHLAFLQRLLPRDLFNTYILGLRSGEPLDLLMREQIEHIIARLEAFPKMNRT